MRRLDQLMSAAVTAISMVKIPDQKKVELNNRDAEKFWPETCTADRVDKKSFAEFLGEVETYLSVLAPGMRLTREMFERSGLTAQCSGCRAVRNGVGCPANHTERCRERIEQELEKERGGASKVARDREGQASQSRGASQRHENRGPEQRPHREVIEGTGASSSRDDAGNDPPPRPAESSASVDQPPREQSDDASMGDPESDRRSLGRKEKQRGSGSMSSMAKKAMNGWRTRKSGCESTVVPDEDCSLPAALRADPS